MELTGAGPGSVGGTNGFLFLRVSKYDARSAILRRTRSLYQVVMSMA